LFGYPLSQIWKLLKGPRLVIFRDLVENGVVWVESAQGLERAKQRMEQIATEQPGKYFVFDLQTAAILAKMEAARELHCPNEPIFDIFSGTSDKDAVWLESVPGLSTARERMERIATVSPGAYFLYNSSSRSILARSDTSKHLHTGLREKLVRIA
jgi:hypothetical protein